MNKHYSNSGKMDYATGYAVQTPDGGYAIAGDSDGQFILFKTDASGTEQWSKTYGGLEEEKLTSLEVAGDGGYILGGYVFTRKLGYSELHNHFVVKTNRSGIEQWSKTIGNSENENVDYMLKQATPTSDGGASIFGWKVKHSSSGVFQGGFAQLIKLSANQTVPETGLRLDSEDYSMSVGQTLDTVLTAVYGGNKVIVSKNGTYKMADQTVASVDAAGNITGLKNGQTVLTATYNGLSVKANVYVYGKVEQPMPGLKLDSEDYSVSSGQTLDTVLTSIYGGNKVNVNKDAVFKIADPAIASLDAAGNISGLHYGQTVLTATYNKMETKANVFVY